MADQRTFTLIGEFQDGITPELEKINNAINTFKRNMMTMTTRKGGGFSDVTQSVGKLVSAQKHLKAAIEEVGAAAKAATGELKDYKHMVGKVASAHHAMNKSTNTTGQRLKRQWEGASDGVVKYRRDLQSLGRLERAERQKTNRITQGGGGGGGLFTGSRSYIPRTFSPPSFGGGGDGPRPPRRGGGGYHGGVGYDGNFSMSAFAFGMTLGQGLSQPITMAIMSGFQLGIGLMTKPFEYFGSQLGERMQDEMSDLKAAGGFFSINRMAERKFLEKGTFQEAIDFMQKNNLLMSKLAGSLPGSTQDFIEVNKRISDSIAAMVTNAPERSMALAEKIRQQETSTAYSSIGPITGPANAKGMQNAMQILMADLTKQTVLAGQGSMSGPQGAMGAYGLPQLTERMLSQQDISMAQMQRYAAIFRDPMIMRNLEKELPKITSTIANTPERFAALRGFFERVLPPELVERYRRTLLGVQETFNTSIFSPETGIFGLGRKMKDLGGAFNEFGQMIDKNNKVVTDINKQARIDLDIYQTFRDTIANIGRILAPIAENLSQFWDPLRMVGELLEKARVVTFDVLRSFEVYLKSFGDFAKGFTPAELDRFRNTGGKELRASLATIANLFNQLNVISTAEFEGIMDKLILPDLKGGEILKGLLDKFFTSNVAEQIGDFIGTLVGTVLSEVARVTGFFEKNIVGDNKLIKGLMAGFERAGGTQAFKQIFTDVFKLLFRILGNIIKILPPEAYILAGAAVFIPAAVAGLSMALGEWMTGLFVGMQRVIMTQLAKARVAILAQAKINSGILGFTGGGKKITTGMGGASKAGKGAAASRVTGVPPVVTTGMGGTAGFQAALARMAPFLAKLTVTLAAITIVGGGVESTLRQLQQIFGELGQVLMGVLGGLGDVFGVIIDMGADAVRRFLSLFGAAEDGMDNLKILFAPITLALQALSQGLIGLALLFAELRVTLARLTNDPKLKEIEKQRDKLLKSLVVERGRINAYNASMLGRVNLQKQVDKSLKELSDTTKKLTQARKDELLAFIEEAKRLDPKLKTPKKLPDPKATPYSSRVTPTPKSKEPPMRRITVEWFKKLGDDIDRGLLRIKLEFDGFIDWLTPTRDKFVNLAGSLGQTAASIYNAFVPVVEGIKQMGDDIDRALLNFLLDIESGFNNFLNWITDLPADLKDRVDRAILGLQIEIEIFFQNLTDKGGEAVAQVGGLNPKKILDWVLSLPASISFDAVLAPLKAGWDSFVAWLKSIGTDRKVIDQTKTKLQSQRAELGSAIFTSITGAIKDAVAKFKAEFAANAINIDPATGKPLNPPAKTRAYGHGGMMSLGGAISTEMRNKPVGSNLVIANDEEYIFPKKNVISAATGHIPKFSRMVGALARNQGPSSPIKYDEGMGGYVPNPGAGRPANIRYKGFPLAYTSPNGMYRQGGTSTAAAPINVTSPITINTQPGQDAEEIASIVAMKIGDAVAQARASSVFV